MVANKLAIPAAIGSGGLSLAITTGAGAVIGGALADNNQYVSGAVRGAWEGAGLTIFDPIVQKGQEAIFPVGTVLDLKLAHTTDIAIPSYAIQSLHTPGLNQAVEPGRATTNAVSSDYLITWARILPRSGLPAQKVVPTPAADYSIQSTIEDDRRLVGEVTRRLEEKDFAGALAAVESAFKVRPCSPTVIELRTRIRQITLGE